jgi:hypothetical protein
VYVISSVGFVFIICSGRSLINLKFGVISWILFHKRNERNIQLFEKLIALSFGIEALVIGSPNGIKYGAFLIVLSSVLVAIPEPVIPK